ncbi:DUF805 domain-containing protein [Methanimicrococcus blatticola]|uniref:Uncharacterized membrane protein YhaH (DUF805 family) n=1 Tax=Methanimicrococcus blatticola TaxID=91560 RepID=A0A484F596_9EURY|nr:DUF805 domain-containing protein [Methanimicrococcus blatticola]MBZ3936093.1 DUF805 domain-containing protein [Methanimicrococcus blatticola]MCC2509299.1 DUF805 domain-containing protein [Methanimicrococcus blatticola]TDQ68186.1 uncharacterized membrane protein YhaH (DUF805 family) [Methanimicrococcus blatticola]
MANHLKENINEFRRYDGRITRKTYIGRVIGRWILTFVAAMLIQFLNVIIYMMITGLTNNSDNAAAMTIMSFIILPITFIVFLPLFFMKIFQEIRRLHDMNAGGWWVILGFIPAINIVYYIFLIFNDGTYGPNKYGDDPKGRK